MAFASLWWKSLLWSAVLRCSLATFARAFSQFFEPLWVLWSYCFLDKLCWNRRRRFAWTLIHLGLGTVNVYFAFPNIPNTLSPRSTEMTSSAWMTAGNTGRSITVSICRDTRYRLFVLVTVADFMDTPRGCRSASVFPFGSTNRTLPIFGSFRYGSPSIIFNSMLLFV